MSVGMDLEVSKVHADPAVSLSLPHVCGSSHELSATAPETCLTAQGHAAHRDGYGLLKP